MSLDRAQFHRKASLVLLVGVISLLFFSIRLSNILIIAYLVNWLFGSTREAWRGQRRDWLLLLIVSPWLLEIVSILYSCHTRLALHLVEKRLTLLAIPIVTVHSVSNAVKERGAVFRVAIVCTLAVTLFCLLVAAYKFVYESVNTFYWYDFTGPTALDPGYMSLLINVLCVWIVHELISDWDSPSPIRKSLYVALITYFGIIIFLLSSKIHAVIFVAIVVGGLVIMYRKYVVSWKVTAVVVALLVVVGFTASKSEIVTRYAQIDTFAFKFNAPDEDFNELTLRLAILKCSSYIIKENPVFGTGVGDVMPELVSVYRRVDFPFGYNNAYDPHNYYLRVCMGTGVVGLALFLVTLMAAIRIAIRSKDWMLLGFMMVYCSAFLFECVLDRHSGIVIYAFFYSVLLFGNRERGTAQVGRSGM